MSTYSAAGHSYLVCPRLLELDPRHGDHPSKWAPCRRQAVDAAGHLLDERGEVHRDAKGRPAIGCRLDHKHEALLEDLEGHMVNDFVWLPGCRPPTSTEHPVCGCGRELVHADLDDLYDPVHLVDDEDLEPPAPRPGGFRRR